MQTNKVHFLLPSVWYVRRQVNCFTHLSCFEQLCCGCRIKSWKWRKDSWTWDFLLKSIIHMYSVPLCTRPQLFSSTSWEKHSDQLLNKRRVKGSYRINEEDTRLSPKCSISNLLDQTADRIGQIKCWRLSSVHLYIRVSRKAQLVTSKIRTGICGRSGYAAKRRVAMLGSNLRPSQTNISPLSHGLASPLPPLTAPRSSLAKSVPTSLRACNYAWLFTRWFSVPLLSVSL